MFHIDPEILFKPGHYLVKVTGNTAKALQGKNLVIVKNFHETRIYTDFRS
ncbi:hypothetical protein [Leptospira kmetyi]|nr:hypothetical protein [Leptospira kmetyi]